MKIHLIATGGSAMHNMAIALHLKGYQVTGSDDEIFEPSKGRLKKYGLLPDNIGWNANNITSDLDAVILGMHAREDNPELLKAQELGLNIYSYPEYIFNQSKDKKRIVIGGSHGKTSITAMILHVLNELDFQYDYMVGAQLEGFECMVKLSHDAPIIILEGDEYLSSPIDRRPKFHLYKPHTAVISGIAWDHINVFPTFDNYADQFQIFTDLIEDGGKLIYCESDSEVKSIGEKFDGTSIPYGGHEHKIINGKTTLLDEGNEYPISVFGGHNLQNLNAALNVCSDLGIDKHDFYNAIANFTGASKRLELVRENTTSAVYKDFAHSPSKLKATSNAMKEQFENRSLVACMELHTFSSLNEDFLKQYEGCMDAPDTAYVFFSPKALAHKKLPDITSEQVHRAFGRDDLKVFTSSQELITALKSKNWENQNLLLMSSGNFEGVDFNELATELIG
ncbi:MAG: UDP-N-acetylmuramate: L-alanyl-gamma-D-glutamyl-meso-diaminopimelate ligase [Saprospiraceae bacterium]|jgi:UDP-N-acetylmuramate: L-alanyl-gamma-D-glutamyl-meso-diaminopimelate ligase